MLEFAIAIVAIFVLAGFVKGVLGLGLPIDLDGPAGRGDDARARPQRCWWRRRWRRISGRWSRDLTSAASSNGLARCWPSSCVGTWLGAGWLTGPYARYGAITLGLLLIVYAILSLVRCASPFRARGNLARPDRRIAHRPDHGGDRRVRDPGDHLHARHWPGEGRAGAGTWPVVHRLDGCVDIQSGRRRRLERLARRHGHHCAGRSSRRHVDRTDRPPQARSGDVPPLVLHRLVLLGLYLSAGPIVRALT